MNNLYTSSALQARAKGTHRSKCTSSMAIATYEGYCMATEQQDKTNWTPLRTGLATGLVFYSVLQSTWVAGSVWSMCTCTCNCSIFCIWTLSGCPTMPCVLPVQADSPAPAAAPRLRQLVTMYNTKYIVQCRSHITSLVLPSEQLTSIT